MKYDVQEELHDSLYYEKVIAEGLTKSQEVKKMKTLKEEALAYEPPQLLNIADLDEVPVDISIDEKEAKDREGNPFTYKYATLNGKEYRVANTVLEKLQEILKLKPEVTKVKVLKSGSGLATRYRVEVL